MVSHDNAHAATLQSIAGSKRWQRLLHYRFHLWGGRKSDLDGSGFFFSPKGKTDPVAELEASARAFGENREIGKLKLHPQCAFPERYRFVKEALHLQTKDVPCPLLDRFLERFHHPQSAALVFSNAYPDNPASMFGHTFLRINAAPPPGETRKLDLLDQGVSYAANVGPDESPLVFYYLGLTGGYPGAFSVVPYYAKVNEYTHSEARDLWEYDLDLNEAQTLTLLRHLWEIEINSHFNYWFFDQNCAFQLLALLEVAREDWTMTDTPPWVIPGETVKIITRAPGAVKAVHFRPSYRRTLVSRYEALSEDEKNQFFLARDGRLDPDRIQSLQVIDALSAYWTYQKQKNEGTLPPDQKLLLTQTLTRRSSFHANHSTQAQEQADRPDVSAESASALMTRPDLGHDAQRFSLSTGFSGLSTHSSAVSRSAFEELHWRSAYHDLLNEDLGFLRFSKIEFPNITFRYYTTPSDLRVERVGILSVLSLFPFSPLEKKPSWGFDLAYVSPKDFGCVTCHTLRLQTLGGITFEPVKNDMIIYALALANAEVGENLRKGWRLGPGAETAIVANPLPHFKTELRYQVVTDLFQSDRSFAFSEWSLEHSLTINRSWEVRAGYLLDRSYDELKFGVHYYF